MFLLWIGILDLFLRCLVLRGVVYVGCGCIGGSLYLCFLSSLVCLVLFLLLVGLVCLGYSIRVFLGLCGVGVLYSVVFL